MPKSIEEEIDLSGNYKDIESEQTEVPLLNFYNKI
jgi:hypothetical protein